MGLIIVFIWYFIYWIL